MCIRDRIRIVRPEDGTECRTRCKGTADPLALLSLRDGITRRRAAHDGFDSRPRVAIPIALDPARSHARAAVETVVRSAPARDAVAQRKKSERIRRALA